MTVEEYYLGLAPPARQFTLALRGVIRIEAPELTEELKWGTPAFLHPGGVIMVVIAAHRAHANIVFTPSTKEAFAEELAGFATGKGSIRLRYGLPLPEELVRRMVRFRVREYEEQGVKWM